jgi:hypothetical protein
VRAPAARPGEAGLAGPAGEAKEKHVRITRPLIGTAVGAGALGASLALGLTMASASTSAHTGTAGSHPAAAPSSSASPSVPGGKGTKHKCPNMGGSGNTASAPGGM